LRLPVGGPSSSFTGCAGVITALNNQPKEATMGRNTQILEEIVNVLHLPHGALVHLERHFDHRLILDAGNVDAVAEFAAKLRLRVANEECPLVLDYIATQGMVSITVDVVEQAVNELLGEDRFIEPER